MMNDRIEKIKKRSTAVLARSACLCAALLCLASCGVRPYDHLTQPWHTLSAGLWGSPTVGVTLQMVPTFTPLPLASATPSRTASPSATWPAPTHTATPLPTPPRGTAQVWLENRTPYTLYVRLEGKTGLYTFELAAAEAYEVTFPSGVYDYWIILDIRENLYGEKAFYPGTSGWVFYDTPGLLESPTPLPALE